MAFTLKGLTDRQKICKKSQKRVLSLILIFSQFLIQISLTKRLFLKVTLVSLTLKARTIF